MRVVVPYTTRRDEVAAALPPDTEWVDVSGDEHAYWRMMRGLWADGETFMVVEHDVVIHDQVIAQFASCPEPWCAFPYDNICHWACMEAWANTLGCTRFSAELVAATPRALDLPEDLRGWHNLCDHLAGNKTHGTDTPLRPGSVRAAGFAHHWHFPPVHHDHGQTDITVDWQNVADTPSRPVSGLCSTTPSDIRSEPVMTPEAQVMQELVDALYQNGQVSVTPLQCDAIKQSWAKCKPADTADTEVVVPEVVD